jgi:hypothetical protein
MGVGRAVPQTASPSPEGAGLDGREWASPSHPTHAGQQEVMGPRSSSPPDEGGGMKIGGIGVMLTSKPYKVVQVVRGGAVWASGARVEEGDSLVSVGGRDVENIPLRSATSKP